MARVIVLGLDGATFLLLDPLLSDNRLPNLARLAREGTRGRLLSTIHPLTPAAWTTAVTGLNPGKHGIFDFRRRSPESYELLLANASWRDGQPLWTMLSAMGKRVGVFNVPMTYPPDPVNGFLVSGMDAPGTQSAFAYPVALRQTLLAALPEYRIDVDEGTPSEEEYLARVEALSDAHLAAFDLLVEQNPQLDFLMAVFVATDRLYHAFWRYLDPACADYGAPAAESVRRVHERILVQIDERLGRLRAAAGDDATVIIMSDHGFGPLLKDVYMNRFLVDNGWLSFLPSAGDGPLAGSVDWQKTRAYSFGFFGNICLNLRGREPQGIVEQGREEEQLKARIIAALRELRDPEDGERLVTEVFRREEIYSGPHVGDAPDLLVIMRNYAYMTRDGYEGVRNALLGQPMSLSRDRLIHSGNHRLDGVLIMAGPGISPGTAITGATLQDIAPTVLHALGLPAPAIMDGRVLRQAYTEDSLRAQPPRRLLAPPPPPRDAAGERRRELEQQAAALRARISQINRDQQEATRYAASLEDAIAEKNRHIAEIVERLRRREAEMGEYQQSAFFRAYQRWKGMRGGR